MPSPQVPVSWGELLDKISILRIKQQRIADPAALGNVGRELMALEDFAASALADNGVRRLFDALTAVNEALWDIEDAIRREEARSRFGPEFVRLARSVYRQNDRRAELKRSLNRLLGSELVEEKSYWSAKASASAPQLQIESVG
ncbi:MAG: hypothetical protein J2O44_05140 [Porphyrobacter sp.]|nr:hypothetical protein [Porphyrobacter sp.]